MTENPHTDPSPKRVGPRPARALPRRRLIVGGLGAAGMMGLTALAGPAPAQASGRPAAKEPHPMTTPTPAHGTRMIEFHAWQAMPRGRGREPFLTGHGDGAVLTGRGVAFGRAAGRRRFADPFVDADDGSAVPGAGPQVDYDTCTWTGPLHRLTFGAQEVIVSFNAETPGRSWVEVQIQVLTRADSGGTSSAASSTGQWFTMARWCRLMPQQGGAIHRASVDGQDDGAAAISTDTLVAAQGREVVGYRLRVTLLRPHGSDERPAVRLLGAVCSRLPDDPAVTASTPGPAAGRELHVAPLSQMTHKGQYPQWGGGGESWCSPTSVAMAMGYHRAGPSKKELSWVSPSTDAVVAFSARATWDHEYGGAGNWAFSAAYPACYGLEGFVTRLTSLRQAEQFILAGIPLVASVRFKASELDGAGYSTNGHLLLIIGFTDDGDVIVNDPASHMKASNDEVRVVYRRDQFENVWLPRSGGTVYVIAPPRAPLPPGAATGI